MSDSAKVIVPTKGRTELKVRVAAGATFIATTFAIAFLQEAAPDFVKDLPVWAQAPAGALILAAVTYLAGRQTKSKPGYLSPSTIEAAQEWIRKRARPVR